MAAETASRFPSQAAPVEGGCRCGRVRFRIGDAPLLEVACHCRGCQRMTASAFSTSIAVADTGFALIAGQTVRGGLGGATGAGEVHHHHCGDCLSWLYTSFPGDLGFVNVRGALLDDPSWHAPWLEVQTDDRLPWARTSAARSFAGFPPAEDYPGFIAEYRAAQGIA